MKKILILIFFATLIISAKAQVNKIQHDLQPIIEAEIEKVLSGTGFDSDGITGYITDTKIGEAEFEALTFTVPLWAYERTGYFTYYVAHELSHLLAYIKYGDKGKGHGEYFYEVFMEICPQKLQYFELCYEPSFEQYFVK